MTPDEKVLTTFVTKGLKYGRLLIPLPFFVADIMNRKASNDEVNITNIART
jgi:hypothetical protein